MEPDPQQVVDVATKVLDVELKHGPIRRIASALSRRKPNEQPLQQMNFREEAVNAALENAVERIASQELTVEQAFQILGNVATFDDLDKLNSTWQRHWSESVSKVGIDDEERRTWWARLLAGEIQQPGTFSLRAMALMDKLSTDEAQLFSKLCDYVWNPSNPVLILPSENSTLWKPDFAESTLLESIGLFKFDSLGGFTWGTRDNKAEVVPSQQVPAIVPMVFNDEAFVVVGPGGKQLRLRCGKLFFTDVGKELFRLTTPRHPLNYRDEIVGEWRQSYTVQVVQIAPTLNS